MNPLYERARAFGPAIANIRRGIEKESLRVRPDGSLATTPHPAGLGSPLTHPRITTDFSEAQLELITGVHAHVHTCVEELTCIHQVVYRQLPDELLWCASMPCKLPADDAIPIARYGSSNVGRAKTVYRMGLAHRYGRRMQTISGIHYNFSLGTDASSVLTALGGANDAYFRLLRNFRRHSWLLLYLLGASPAVCESFVAGRKHGLQAYAPGTLYAPHATSLRMGSLGYQSEAQAALAVSYSSLDDYAASLETALSTPYPPYAAIGVTDGDDYRQLSTSLLQIENEFYSTIRPKRTTRSGERPLHALRERGVEYVEVRLIDLDPFSPIGITTDAICLLDVFLLHCLLVDSPPDTPEEIAAIGRNQHTVALRGREPGLTLERGSGTVPLAQWGAELLDQCAPIADVLDGGVRTVHQDALASAAARLSDARLTPSARMLETMERQHARSHLKFTLARSREHRSTLESMPLSRECEERLARMAAESVGKQREIEAADTVPFETYRSDYLSPERLTPNLPHGSAGADVS